MISVDGTNISEVTIDGETVSEITIDGVPIWSATPKQVIDFENGDLSAFSGDLGGYTIESGGAYSGNNYLQLNGVSGQYIFSYPGDGLNYYPQRGDTFELFYYSDAFPTGDPPFEEVPIFGAEDASTYYSCFINGKDNRFRLSGSNSNIVSANFPNETWIRIIIDFDSAGDGIITATLENASTGNQFAQVSIEDTSINGRGVGLEADIWGNLNQDRRVDNWRLVE